MVGHGDEVHQGRLLQDADAGIGPNGPAQGVLDGPARRVLGVIDAAGGMGSLLGGFWQPACVCVEGDSHLAPEEFLAQGRAALGQEFHGLRTAETRPCGFDVPGQQFGRIAPVLLGEADDAALGIGRVGLAQGILDGHDHVSSQLRRMESGGAACDTSAQDQYITNNHSSSQVGRGRSQRGARSVSRSFPSIQASRVEAASTAAV